MAIKILARQSQFLNFLLLFQSRDKNGRPGEKERRRGQQFANVIFRNLKDISSHRKSYIGNQILFDDVIFGNLNFRPIKNKNFSNLIFRTFLIS